MSAIFKRAKDRHGDKAPLAASIRFELAGLERFPASARSGLIRVSGRWWSHQPRRLAHPCLVFHGEDGARRVAPLLGAQLEAAAGPDGPGWQAAYPASAELAALDDDRLVLELAEGEAMPLTRPGHAVQPMVPVDNLSPAQLAAIRAPLKETLSSELSDTKAKLAEARRTARQRAAQIRGVRQDAEAAVEHVRVEVLEKVRHEANALRERAVQLERRGDQMEAAGIASAAESAHLRERLASLDARFVALERACELAEQRAAAAQADLREEQELREQAQVLAARLEAELAAAKHRRDEADRRVVDSERARAEALAAVDEARQLQLAREGEKSAAEQRALQAEAELTLGTREAEASSAELQARLQDALRQIEEADGRHADAQRQAKEAAAAEQARREAAEADARGAHERQARLETGIERILERIADLQKAIHVVPKPDRKPDQNGGRARPAAHNGAAQTDLASDQETTEMVVIQLKLEGASREEATAYLREQFGIVDADRVADRVFGDGSTQGASSNLPAEAVEAGTGG